MHAVLSEGGSKNTKVCVLKIDKSVASLKDIPKITNISYYHSVDFQAEGALYREYFNIGDGKFHPYKGVLKCNRRINFIN